MAPSGTTVHDTFPSFPPQKKKECGRTVGGVRVGWDVSEEVGRVQKYAIFITVPPIKGPASLWTIFVPSSVELV
jgi:hypothetical protein